MQHLVAGLAVLAQGDPDAHGRHHLVPGTERDGVAQRLQDRVGHPGRLIGRGDAFEQDDELVTAETGERVARPHGAAQAIPDDAEQLVAHLVAQVVVDQLEAVDVAEEHRDLAAGPIRLEQGVVEMVEEEPAVGQTGQRVLEGVPGQLLLERLALRGVAEDDDGTRRRRASHDG